MTSKFKKLILGASSVLASSSFMLSAGCSSSSSESSPSNPNTGTTDPGSSTDVSPEHNQRILNSELGPNPDSNKRYTSDVQPKIKIGVTWSESQVQFSALKSVIDEYNKLVKAKSNDIAPGAKEVEIKKLGSGYDSGPEKILQDLKAQNKSEFYNLVLNYPNVASKLANFNMLLSFNDADPAFDTDISEFSKGFQKPNNEIEYVRNQSTYVLPFAKSTHAFAINAPVLSYLIEEMKKAGAKIATDKDTTEFIEQVNKLGKDDRSGVIKKWGTARQGVKVDLEISKATFENYKDLFEFARQAQKLFTESYNNGKAISEKPHVFGITDPISFFEVSVYSHVNGKDEESISYTTTNDGVVTARFDALKGDGTAHSIGGEIYNDLESAVKTGAVKIFPKGQYPSNQQTQHLVAFSNGSTSGYTHNFIKEGEKIYDRGIAQIKDDLSKNNGTLLTIDKNNLRSDVVAKFGKYGNSLYKSTYTPNESDGFNLVFASADDEKAFTDATKDRNGVPNDLLIRISNYNKDKKDFQDLVKEAKENSIFAGIAKTASTKPEEAAQFLLLYIKDAVDVKQKTIKVPVDPKNKDGEKKDQTVLDKVSFKGNAFNDFITKYKFVLESKEDQLNENELITLRPPLKWTREDKLNVVFGQGPSLFGIHTNAEDDRATKAFVKWLTSSKKYLFGEGAKKEKKELTPSEYFDKQSGYITANKDFVNIDASIFGKNKFTQMAVNLFKDGITKEGFTIFEEPASDKSETFRKSVISAFDLLQNSAENSDTPQSYQDFISKINFPQ
ncbi:MULTISPECIES: P68 family surface lipoprotein [unclassified Mycoplasma]|uniref:P68 family surface lipoprotein n=1 Tax=unclassified Mycoplasma TaxID=2683645 RepID=UPI00211BCEFD|nr:MULTISPECIES: P80 family lipoprotein [unclassified Mycoplasma]UUM20008.1 P80 family lipoprotein [Mycoplasma sp. 1578d]UUM24989.1 P80 family lipoprotein [Mycoplasma sp. 3686d]